MASLFFSHHNLAQIRESLHHLQQVALTTDNYYFKTPKERDAIAWFCHDLEELLKAVWLLQQQESKKPSYPNHYFPAISWLYT